MTCQERQARFTEWILGELPAAEARALDQHVAECPACARVLKESRGVEQALRATLTDREMPARLVFLGEPPRAAWLGSLWRAAAAGAVAAVVFLGFLLAGYATLPGRSPAPAAQAGLTKDEVETIVAHIVEARLADEKAEFEAVSEKLAGRLREENTRTLAAVGKKFEYLEALQTAAWKQDQEQNALMELIARNAVQRGAPPTGKP